MKKILIIEDDSELLNILTKKLQNFYQVFSETNAGHGITSAINNLPDCILLDLMLPGEKNGFDVLRELKINLQTKNIPIIVLTNLDNEKQTVMAEGAKEYIIKTNISLDDVLHKIKSVVGE